MSTEPERRSLSERVAYLEGRLDAMREILVRIEATLARIEARPRKTGPPKRSGG